MADIYTAALMEHNAHPDYRYVMDAPTHTREGVNPSCGDALELALRIEDGTIAEAAFTGHGCAVSQASADIMADLIEGEPIEAARHRCELFLSVIRGDALDQAQLAALGEAAELTSIARMPARVKCAELAWRTLEALLDESEAS